MGMNPYKHPIYGTYSIRLPRPSKHPNGKLISMRSFVGYSIKDADKAQEIFNTIESDHLEDKLRELAGVSRIRVSKLSKEFCKDPDRSTLGPDTLRMDKLALKTLIDCVTDKIVRLVKEDDFKKFKSMLLSRDLSLFTINTYRRHILAAFEYAVEQKYINAVSKFKAIKIGDHQPRILRRKEITKILKYAKKNDFEMWRYILFSRWTGCRGEEMLNLQHQHISNDLVIIHGKGDKQRTIRLLPKALEAIGDEQDVGPVFKQWRKDTIYHSQIQKNSQGLRDGRRPPAQYEAYRHHLYGRGWYASQSGPGRYGPCEF